MSVPSKRATRIAASCVTPFVSGKPFSTRDAAAVEIPVKFVKSQIPTAQECRLEAAGV